MKYRNLLLSSLILLPPLSACTAEDMAALNSALQQTNAELARENYNMMRQNCAGVVRRDQYGTFYCDTSAFIQSSSNSSNDSYDNDSYDDSNDSYDQGSTCPDGYQQCGRKCIPYTPPDPNEPHVGGYAMCN